MASRRVCEKHDLLMQTYVDKNGNEEEYCPECEEERPAAPEEHYYGDTIDPPAAPTLVPSVDCPHCASFYQCALDEKPSCFKPIKPPAAPALLRRLEAACKSCGTDCCFLPPKEDPTPCAHWTPKEQPAPAPSRSPIEVLEDVVAELEDDRDALEKRVAKLEEDLIQEKETRHNKDELTSGRIDEIEHRLDKHWHYCNMEGDNGTSEPEYPKEKKE